jgi:hypothetical protein
MVGIALMFLITAIQCGVFGMITLILWGIVERLLTLILWGIV